jgi:hypothetical protein
MGAASTPIRICPECGTRNSGLSLFCAECGASLTHAVVDGADDSQTTATYRPLPAKEPSSDPYATQQFTPQAIAAIQPSGTNGDGHTRSVSSAITSEYVPNTESRRGLVLGWIAGVLILLVIGYLGWTSFLDPDTRDSIIGIFS